MNRKKIFDKICKDIKYLKIQGATNIAKKAFYAYKLIPTKNSKKTLISLRPTEPMLYNILKIADKISYAELIKKLNKSQEKINNEVSKIIKKNSVIFTHCHSSTLVKALVFSKKIGKKFEVYNTETRPLYQGKKTAKELSKAKIKVTMFVDSAAKIALTKEQDKEEKTRPVNIVLLGADALTKDGVVNKVGSGMFSQIAKSNHIPVFIVSSFLKFTNKKIKFEQRNPKEIWNPTKKINIKNPSFELIEKKDIFRIITELGTLSYDNFLKKVKRFDFLITNFYS